MNTGIVPFRTIRYVFKARARFALSETVPKLFCYAERWSNGIASRTVRSSTDLVIEGYPRSGNSFTVSVLGRRVGPGWRIAHHVHLPVQIELAIYWKRPTLVLLRHPMEATISFVGLQLQASLHERGQYLSEVELAWRLRQAVREYALFYEKVLILSNLGTTPPFVFAPFRVITDELGSVFSALNAKFGLDIPDHKVTAEERELIFRSSSYHLAPNAERDGFKGRIEQLYTVAVSEVARQRAFAAFEACTNIISLQAPGWLSKKAE